MVVEYRTHRKKGTCYLLNNGVIGVLFLDQSTILFCLLRKHFIMRKMNLFFKD